MGEMQQEIKKYLKKNKFCVLATCGKDMPRATPVRFWADGLDVFIYSEKYTAKFKNLKKNATVSLAMYGARAPLRGLQLWGTAEVIPHTDPRHAAHLPPVARKNPKMQAACKVLNLIKVLPRRIVMFDQGRKGAPYIVWECDKRGREKEYESVSLRGLTK
ncbi:pyridoxamine 5'-phosphate oxidase family protein [Thermodesulfobacteriota bacterium]